MAHAISITLPVGKFIIVEILNAMSGTKFSPYFSIGTSVTFNPNEW